MLLFVVLGRFGVFGVEVLGAGRVFLLVLEGAMAGFWWSMASRSGMMRNGGVRGEGRQAVGTAGWPNAGAAMKSLHWLSDDNTEPRTREKRHSDLPPSCDTKNGPSKK